MTTLAPSDLLGEAVTARERAYAPYSHFAVGAALLAPDGRVFRGANVENASYGLSMCAERVAIYRAVSAGVRQFLAVAVAGPDGVVAMPCGACRQVLHEFGPAMQVVIAAGTEIRVIPLSSLLPEAFSGGVLEALQAGPGRDVR